MNKTLFIQIFVIASIVGAYFFIDFDELYNSFKPEVKYTVQNKDCDLHKSECKIKVGNKEYSLEVFPKDIPLMKNLTFKLKTDEKNLEKLQINIYATNMFMGDFYLKFNETSKGVYEAKGTLPTCPVGKMQWNADVQLKDNLGARFQFQTK